MANQTYDAWYTSSEISDVDFSPQIFSNNNIRRLTALAEQAMHGFLSKSFGNSEIEWVSVPHVELDPELDGCIYISNSCVGVAARVDTYIPLGPIEIINILKQYSCWYRDCRKAEVFGSFPTANGGVIELIYLQVYGPTTLAASRDFRILRFTLPLNDNRLAVCTTSIPSSIGGSSFRESTGFKRAKMLPSGYILQPCSKHIVQSKLTIIDHLDLEFKEPSIPSLFQMVNGQLQALRPLYESSAVLAQRMTLAGIPLPPDPILAIYHVHHIAKEQYGNLDCSSGFNPAMLRSFSHRLNRGYNEAVNGFKHDNWFLIKYESRDDMTLSIKQVHDEQGQKEKCNAVLGVKARLVLLDVYPPTLLQVLKRERAEWSDFRRVGSNSIVTLMKSDLLELPGCTSRYLEKGISVGITTNQDEAFELFRYEDRTHQENPFVGAQYLAQISSGLDGDRFAGCSELIFAPFNRMLQDHVLPLSSGFRITTLNPNAEIKPMVNIAGAPTSRYPVVSGGDSERQFAVMTISFQFPIPHVHQVDFITSSAQQYIRHVISVVQSMARAIAYPSAPRPSIVNGPSFMISKRICECYRFYFGRYLLAQGLKPNTPIVEHMWYHKAAILCCTLERNPVCFLANQAGLNMLEISQFDSQGVPLEMLFGNGEDNVVLSPLLSAVMEEGYYILNKGICLSTKQNFVSYDLLVAWNVSGGDNDRDHLALALVKWKFI